MSLSVKVTDLEAHGLYGPAHCTCLDEYPVVGTRSVFCNFCEAVESLLESESKAPDAVDEA